MCKFRNHESSGSLNSSKSINQFNPGSDIFTHKENRTSIYSFSDVSRNQIPENSLSLTIGISDLAQGSYVVALSNGVIKLTGKFSF